MLKDSVRGKNGKSKRECDCLRPSNEREREGERKGKLLRKLSLIIKHCK